MQRSQTKDFIPKTFVECLEYLATISGIETRNAGVAVNNTVFTLANQLNTDDHLPQNEMGAYTQAVLSVAKRNNDINKIRDVLDGFNAKRFIPLVTTAREAASAMALYAGDGIVAKVTRKSDLNGLRPSDGLYRTIPKVLPPIHTVETGSFIVELFPWINTENITQEDVQAMEVELAKLNLKMNPKDAKINNIGKLPDGTLAILDGNAVERKDSSHPIDETLLLEWEQNIQEQFAGLFDREQTKLISDRPDFSMKFSPLRQSKQELKAASTTPETQSTEPNNPDQKFTNHICHFFSKGRSR